MKIINNIPGLKQVVARLIRFRQSHSFAGSDTYWEKRYLKGGNSGRGSYGELANYKAAVLNGFVKENHIASVIEFGCGDGNQLSFSDYQSYIGLDVSVSAIKSCIEKYKDDKTKSFYLYNSLAFQDNRHLLKADLALSLDVTYHLIEFEVYNAYLNHLFNAAGKYVIIYAWDVEGRLRGHVLHRKFSLWVQEHKKEWILLRTNTDLPKDPHACDFYIYKRTTL